MTDQQRLDAGRSQCLAFLETQYPKWRLTAVLTDAKIIRHIYSFYEGLLLQVKQADDPTGKHTVSNEIYAGLLLRALSETMQFIEELFALLLSTQDFAWFAKNMITYKAGKVTNSIKQYHYDINQTCRLFHIPELPPAENWPSPDSYRQYLDSAARLLQRVLEVVAFYRKNEFLYNQYKHGLAIMFRMSRISGDAPEPKDIDPDQGKPIMVYDNLRIGSAEKAPNRFNGSVSLWINPYTQPHVAQLDKESNLLRFIIDLENQNINVIERIARVVSQLLECARANVYRECSFTESKQVSVWLPAADYSEQLRCDFNLP